MTSVEIAKKIKKLNLNLEVEKNLITLLKNGQYEDVSSIIDDLFHKVADLAMGMVGLCDDYDDLETEICY